MKKTGTVQLFSLAGALAAGLHSATIHYTAIDTIQLPTASTMTVDFSLWPLQQASGAGAVPESVRFLAVMATLPADLSVFALSGLVSNANGSWAFPVNLGRGGVQAASGSQDAGVFEGEVYFPAGAWVGQTAGRLKFRNDGPALTFASLLGAPAIGCGLDNRQYEAGCVNPSIEVETVATPEPQALLLVLLGLGTCLAARRRGK